MGTTKRAITAVALSPETRDILHQLMQDVSDAIGRTISSSAVVRGLLRQAARPDGHRLQVLVDEIETELGQGIRWGHQAGWNTPHPVKRGRTRQTRKRE